MEKIYKTCSIKDLIPYENNPRINADAVKYVAESIKQCEYISPIVVDENMVVLAGHTRLRALKKLKRKQCEILQIIGMNEEQKKKYRLLDNKTGEFADWDFDLLEQELEGLDFGDLDIDWGIDDIELDIGDAEPIEKDDDVFYFDTQEIKDDVVAGWVKYKTLEDYIKNIIDIPTAKYQFNRLCQGYNEGYNISLLFNPHRLDTATIKSGSIFEAINTNEKYAEQFARYMVDVSAKVLPPTQYYKYIGIGSGGIQYVNEFPPYTARDIYKKYCNDGSKILNPCAGWGGRLIGLASCMFEDVEYVETDPSTKTFEGLKKIKEFLHLGSNYKQFNQPFEELKLKKNYFDFAFTSPPYFNTEIYSNEETQSYKNKDDYESWRDRFLFVMLDKIYDSLKIGGYCLLNVGKVRYPIDDDIINYMQNKYNVDCHRIGDFRIGGAGIGARTDDDGQGEPFIEFRKEV